MKTIAETYRDRLNLLIQQSGSQIAFAEKINKSPSQVSQWVNASPDSKTGKPRSLTEKSARQIEHSLGLPRAWMDQPLSASMFPPDDAKTLSALSLEDGSLVEHITFSPIGLKTLLSGQESTHVKFIMPTDDSMMPAIKPHSLVLIQTNITHFEHNGIYLFTLQGQLFLRRLHLGKHNVINITSDNHRYQDSNFTMLKNECHQIDIIGKAWKVLPLTLTDL